MRLKQISSDRVVRPQGSGGALQPRPRCVRFASSTGPRFTSLRGPLCADTVEKVRKLKSRETISRVSIAMSKDDSKQRQSLNHCFVAAAIVSAEQTFSTVSAKSRLFQPSAVQPTTAGKLGANLRPRGYGTAEFVWANMLTGPHPDCSARGLRSGAAGHPALFKSSSRTANCARSPRREMAASSISRGLVSRMHKVPTQEPFPRISG